MHIKSWKKLCICGFSIEIIDGVANDTKKHLCAHCHLLHFVAQQMATVWILTLLATNVFSLNEVLLSLKYIGLNHSNSEWYNPNLMVVFVRMAFDNSAIKSRCGPTSIEFQLNEYFEGHKAYPSWCLLVKTTYLRVNRRTTIENKTKPNEKTHHHHSLSQLISFL